MGASPLPASVREDFAAHTGRRLLEGYGLTEATCATTWTRPGEERPGSVGRVLPGQQIKAVTIGADGSWTDCGPGETGVLVIGGPAVFAGYVTDPALGGPRVSRDGIVHDGWLDTGDLGQVDDGGLVYLTGRAKDLIIRGGHNIDPRVIEDALLAHPAVRAAAAVGRPDRHSGEVPVAYVVPAGPGPFDETELLAWAAAPPSARPPPGPNASTRSTAIPVTEVGKPFKPALAADAAVRAITEALTAAGVADARVTAAHEDGRLVLTVTGADPGPRARRRRRIRPHRPLRAVARRPDHREVTREKGTTTMNDQYPATPRNPSSSSAPDRPAAPRPSCSPTSGSPSPCWNATRNPTRCPARCTWTTRSPGPWTGSASARDSWPGPGPAADCACWTPGTA